MFRDIANTWWKSVCQPYRVIPDDDAQTTFERKFRKKFILDHVTRKKKDEFHSLKEELMMVVEHIHEFTCLSQFVPESVDTEVKKYEYFVEWLGPLLKKDVTMCQRPATFDDAVERAFWSEQQHQNVLMHEPKCSFTPSSKSSQQQL